MAESAVGNLKQSGIVSVNRADRMIEFAGGGLLGIYSADNPDSMRGENFHLAVLDEAARISQEAYEDVISPTLADHDGDVILISTPKGLNWFFQEYQRGLGDGAYQAAFHAPSSDNPNPNIQRAAELAKERVPTRTYHQEWLAEFVTDGAFFQNVEACAVVTAPDSPAAHADHTIIAGLDWGLKEDYTVLTLICRQCSKVVDWYRTSGGDYIGQRARIKALCERWHLRELLPERNSMGAPNIELLRADGLMVALGPDMDYGWFMTATNKPILIERLALALEKGDIKVPASYADELRAFEVETRPVGPPKYEAPEGQHDDKVVSLALAYYLAQAGPQIW